MPSPMSPGLITYHDHGHGRGKDDTENSPSTTSLRDVKKRPKHWMRAYRTEIAASTGTVLSTVIAFPLESIKSRLQASKDIRSPRDIAVEAWKTEGMKGFFRGATIPMLSITAVRTISFSVYQKIKYFSSDFIARNFNREAPLVLVNRPGSLPDWSTLVTFGVSGACAGASTTLVACPFELTKNAMVLARTMANDPGAKGNELVRKSYESKNSLGTMRQIVKNLGPTGLYTGFQLHFIRDTLGTAIYFMSYESAKQILVKLESSDSPVAPTAVAIAGGLSGMTSLAFMYPIDRAKTAYQRLRLDRTLSRTCPPPRVEYLVKHSWRGLGVAAARSALTNMIFFSTFEAVKKKINRLEV